MVRIIESRWFASDNVAIEKNMPVSSPNAFEGKSYATQRRPETVAPCILEKPLDGILRMHQACGTAFIASLWAMVPTPSALWREKRSRRQAAATFIRISLSFRFEGLMR